MARKSREVEMIIEDEGLRAMEDEMTIEDEEGESVGYGSVFEVPPEAKRRKIETGTTIEDEGSAPDRSVVEYPNTIETDVNDDVSDCSTDSVTSSFIEAETSLDSYMSLDDSLARELSGFTMSFETWSQGPIYDAQYKDLYDYLKENHFDQVVKEKHEILSWRPCDTREIANEFARKYQDCSPCLGEWDIDACLKDLVEENDRLEELRICKEYEVFLLRSGYWQFKLGRNAPRQKEYVDMVFTTTGCSFTGVQQDFEEWIFELQSCKYEQKIAEIELDDKNRRTQLPIRTQAQYITKKLERAEQLGIISMVDLKSEFRGQKLQPENAASAY